MSGKAGETEAVSPSTLFLGLSVEIYRKDAKKWAAGQVVMRDERKDRWLVHWAAVSKSKWLSHKQLAQRDSARFLKHSTVSRRKRSGWLDRDQTNNFIAYVEKQSKLVDTVFVPEVPDDAVEPQKPQAAASGGGGGGGGGDIRAGAMDEGEEDEEDDLPISAMSSSGSSGGGGGGSGGSSVPTCSKCGRTFSGVKQVPHIFGSLLLIP